MIGRIASPRIRAGLGRFYPYPLAAGSQRAVERALGLMRAELERGMRLTGCSSTGELSRGSSGFDGRKLEVAARPRALFDDRLLTSYHFAG
jgi:FMN-dependent dehydrogenase